MIPLSNTVIILVAWGQTKQGQRAGPSSRITGLALGRGADIFTGVTLYVKTNSLKCNSSFLYLKIRKKKRVLKRTRRYRNLVIQTNKAI
jgi:hypothetical protein